MPMADIAGLVDQIIPSAIDLRRLLHETPEPSFAEHRTTDLVRRFLAVHGIPFHDRHPETGGWADIGERPVVGFRADLDALPITEPPGSPHRSKNEGWMHACGHDAHTAIAAGIAAIAHRGGLHGLRVVFQPGEEAIPGGARRLVDEGVTAGLETLIAFHVDPTLEVGHIGARRGPITASGDTLRITLHGPGGHTSRPHRTVDLVRAAGKLITELPTMLREGFDARVPLVVVFGSVQGGDAPNVIPTEVTVSGTVRTLDMSLWEELPTATEKALDAVLAATGAGHHLDYRRGVAPVVNDSAVVAKATLAIDGVLGGGTVVPTETSMGGEDFSDYLTRVRGALFRLGAASGGGDIHSAGFILNEDAVAVGIRAGIAALRALLD